MTSDGLMNHIMNDRGLLESFMFHLRAIRKYMDVAAAELSTDNAEWHDDTNAEDYGEYHAPSNVQYTRATRDEAIIELVKHYLSEMSIQAK